MFLFLLIYDAQKDVSVGPTAEQCSLASFARPEKQPLSLVSVFQISRVNFHDIIVEFHLWNSPEQCHLSIKGAENQLFGEFFPRKYVPPRFQFQTRFFFNFSRLCLKLNLKWLNLLTFKKIRSCLKCGGFFGNNHFTPSRVAVRSVYIYTILPRLH